MTDARVTQQSLELWAQGTPQAQLTQVAVEAWGSVSATTVQALATQVALEQWAVIAAAASASQARVMVMA